MINIAALKAVNPNRFADGESVWVSGYYASNDGGGGIYTYDADSASADDGGSVIAPTSGSGRYLIVYDGPINVRRFGAKGDSTTDDTSKIQAALGFGVGVRFTTGTYKVTATLVVDNNDTSIIIDAGATIASTINGDDVFDITADRVSLIGPGAIQGVAAWDGANVTPTYAMVNASGHKFVCDGVTINNVQKVGIWVRNASSASIRACYIDGNYPAVSWSGTETGHFGILWDPPSTGEGFRVSGCHIRECVQGVFVGDYTDNGNGFGINISGNVFEGCHNHGTYVFAGAGHVVSGNSFVRCSLPIAMLAKRASVTGNTLATYDTGNNLDLCGISMRDAEDCVVSGNVITGDAPVGAVIVDLGNYSGTEINRNVVSGNTIKIGAGSSSAIRVGRSNQTTGGQGNLIIGNTIQCTGVDATGIIQCATVSGVLEQTVIKNNIIEIKSSSHGIELVNHDRADVSGNTIVFAYDAGSAKTLAFIRESNCSASRISGNTCICRSDWGTNVALRGIWQDSGSTGAYVDENRFDVDTTSIASFTPYILLSPQVNKGGSPLKDSHVGLGKYSAAPTTGTWEQGDVVFNSGAAGSGKAGWICTTAGTPGTWKTWGAIDA